jgi:hypothetical protein
VARVALGDRRGIRALKEAVSFVSPRPRQSDDGEQRLTIERARKAYYDMLERSNKDDEITVADRFFRDSPHCAAKHVKALGVLFGQDAALRPFARQAE